MKKLISLTLCISAFISFSAAVSAEALSAAENWAKNCKKCHGEDGSGQTRIGQRLKLRNYTDPEVQADISDEEIIRILNEGVTDERGREVKPSFKDVLSEEEMQAMIVYIRGMAKKE